MTDCKNLDLAREWAADIDADRETLSQDTIDAAADLISSLPDEWVSADELREVVADHHIDMSEELMEALGALLPAPTPPTLADMTPEERAECQWMQAEVDGRVYEGRAVITDIVEAEGKAKTILPNGQQFSFHISIVTPLPELPRLEWPGSEPEETHFDDLPDEVKQVMEESVEDYKAGRFVDFDTPESAALRPEDVPVGEPWQVEVYGQAAIGYRNDPENRLCWAVVCRNDDSGQAWMYDADVTLIARLVPETSEQGLPFGDALIAHVNRTSVEHHQERMRVNEFDPAYTYRDKDGDKWTHNGNGWVCNDSDQGFDAPPAEYGPYTRIEDTNE